MLISDLASDDPLVLDTHVWVWASGEAGGSARINAAALPAIEEAARARRLFVSTASVWELALKLERGVILVSSDLRAWVRDQRWYPGVRLRSINAAVALDCTRLPIW